MTNRNKSELREKPPEGVYKIRRESDGLFSTGGTCPRFTKKGKVWTSMGALKGHLTLVSDGGRYIPKDERAKVRQQRLQAVYGSCKVIFYVVSVVEKEISEISSIRWQDSGTEGRGPGVNPRKCSHCGHSAETNMLGGPG